MHTITKLSSAQVRMAVAYGAEQLSPSSVSVGEGFAVGETGRTADALTAKVDQQLRAAERAAAEAAADPLAAFNVVVDEIVPSGGSARPIRLKIDGSKPYSFATRDAAVAYAVKVSATDFSIDDLEAGVRSTYTER